MAGDLVEKFIEINGWTTARKAALVAGPVGGVGHLVGGGAALLLLKDTPGIDVTGLAWVFAGFLTVCTLTCLISLYAGRNGADAPWTFYLFGVPYSGLCAAMAWLFGAQSSPLLTWFAVQILLVGILFEARRALIFFGIGLSLYTGLFAISATDLLSFAPLHEDRSLDAQQDVRYVLAMGCTVVLYLVIGPVVAYLSAQARELLQQRLDEANRRLDEAAHLIARYVPAEVAEGILSGDPGISDGHHRRKVTVFFSDLVGFSDIAEELEPEDLALVLNEYFTEMTAIAQRFGGTVDELQGDALLIFFGAPSQTNDKDQAHRAVAMAKEMHLAMDRLNASWQVAGITEQLTVRMGINTGVVTVGNFGSADRKKYAALGKHVNIAARLQSICVPGRTVISYATYLLVNDGVECHPLGDIELKGINRPVRAFEVAQ